MMTMSRRKPSRMLAALLALGLTQSPALAQWRSDGTPVMSTGQLDGYRILTSDGQDGYYVLTGNTAHHLRADASPVPSWPRSLDGKSTYVGNDGRLHLGHYETVLQGADRHPVTLYVEDYQLDGDGNVWPRSYPEALNQVLVERNPDGLGGYYDWGDVALFGSTTILGFFHVPDGTGTNYSNSGLATTAIKLDHTLDGSHGLYGLSSPYAGRILIHRLAPGGPASVGWSTSGVPLMDGLSALYGAQIVAIGTQGSLAVWSDETGIRLKRLGNAPSSALTDPVEVPGFQIGDRPIALTYAAGAALLIVQRGTALLMQSFDSFGEILSNHPEPTLLREMGADATLLGIEPAPGAGLLMIWTDRQLGSGQQIRLVKIAMDASIAPGWPVEGRRILTPVTDQRAAQYRKDANGIVFAWNEVPREGATPGHVADLYMMRVDWNATTLDASPRTPSALAIRDPRPTGHGAIRVRLSLPLARAARIDVFDVQGRRVGGSDIVDTASGERVIEVPVEARPGMCFLQLRQGDAIANARVILLR